MIARMSRSAARTLPGMSCSRAPASAPFASPRIRARAQRRSAPKCWAVAERPDWRASPHAALDIRNKSGHPEWGGRFGHDDDLSRNIIAAPTMSVTTETYTSVANSSQARGVMAPMLFPSSEGIQHGGPELRDRPRKPTKANSHYIVVQADAESGKCRSHGQRGCSQLSSQLRHDLFGELGDPHSLLL